MNRRNLPKRSWSLWHGPSSLFIPVALMILWCLLLWAGRSHRTQSDQYFYFVYNLGLAVIPLVLSLLFSVIDRKWLLVPLGLLWLVFFPNAPYLLTDLIHLRPRDDAPFWFDWMFMISFAAAGFLIGCFSLLLVHRKLASWCGGAKAWLVVLPVWFLTSFGIYLGRFPRWNSWDIATRPTEFFADVFVRLTQPASHPVMVLYTGGLGFLLALGYVVVVQGRLPRSRNQGESDNGENERFRTDSSSNIRITDSPRSPETFS